MKKKVFMGIISVLLVFVIGLTSCGKENDEDTDEALFSISGEFKGAGAANAKFQVATDATSARYARSARSTATSYEMNGELEDGDILFRLKGTYDSSNSSYIVSAAGSFVRYTIEGNPGAAVATLAVFDSESNEWKSFIVNVTIKDVSVKTGASDFAGGFPDWALGYWEDRWSKEADTKISSFEAWSYFNQWYYDSNRGSMWQGNWDYSSTKYTVVESTDIGNGVHDVIFAYPRYKGTAEQHKAAADKFIKEELKISNADYWRFDFAPWDHNVFFDDRPESDDVTKGLNADNTVIWYICVNPAHKKNDPNNPIYGAIHWINYDTFEKELIRTDLASYINGVFTTSFWNEVHQDIDNTDTDPSKWWSDLKDRVETKFNDNNINHKYYYGWFGTGYGTDTTDHLSRTDTCWAPSEDYLTFWADGVVRYWIKWDGQLGVQGDWDKHEFSKWWLDGYLNKYLMSQNVTPETWYSRARIRMNEQDEFIIQYYNGDNDGPAARHSAPACNTKSLTKIKSYTFDESYMEWSYFYKRERPAYRN